MKKVALKKSVIGFSSLMLSSVALACTTVAWQTDFGVINTRTLDWSEPTQPNLETFYAGEKRHLSKGNTYQVKYDFIGITAYEHLVAEGVNKHKLHVNTLYYAPQTSVTGSPKSTMVSQLSLAEYLLSQYKNVAEVVADIENISLSFEQTELLPVAPTMHYALTDSTGDRLVIEHDKDGVKLYRGADYAVMTNQPSMVKHKENWSQNQGLDFSVIDNQTDFGSKGRTNPEDRYLHANYFLNQLEQPTSSRNGMMKLAGITFNIPQDANNRPIDGTMAGYATEYKVTIDVSGGDTVFQYQWGDSWAHHEWNMYQVLSEGKKIKIDLDGNSFALK